MKKNYTIVLDSETCNIVKTEGVTPANNLTYDIGFSVVCPSTGEVVLERSYIVREIFFGETERMKSAYYADKLPTYYKDIAEGKRVIKSFFEIMNELQDLCDNMNIVAIVAHNARFDVDALNTTARWLTGENVRALPQQVEIWDTMQMWNAVKPKAYDKFCEVNGYMTKHRPPRAQLKAEVIYKFITEDVEFIEAHTALEDVQIEREIMFRVYRMHKSIKEVRVLYHVQ